MAAFIKGEIVALINMVPLSVMEMAPISSAFYGVDRQAIKIWTFSPTCSASCHVIVEVRSFAIDSSIEL